MAGSIYPISLDYAICVKKQPGFGCINLGTVTAGDGKLVTYIGEQPRSLRFYHVHAKAAIRYNLMARLMSIV